VVGKLDEGNLHVQFDVAGAGNVAMVELCTHPALERAGLETLHLQPARLPSTLLVVIHKDLSVIQEAEKYIANWLGTMGLQWKPEKTSIVHSLQTHEGNEPGFNFLGFNCRQYRKANERGFKTLIKPEKDKLHRHLMSIFSTGHFF
jgi:hypothetical protein